MVKGKFRFRWRKKKEEPPITREDLLKIQQASREDLLKVQGALEEKVGNVGNLLSLTPRERLRLVKGRMRQRRPRRR